MIDHDLLPYFGEETPVEEISTRDVEALKDLLLGRVSHRTAQKILVILHGVMARAKRKGWITTNPCEDAEKVTVQRSDDFNVLSVEQVRLVEREATSELLQALFLTAAFTGLRMGELLALRWRHIDLASRILMCSATTSRARRTRRRATDGAACQSQTKPWSFSRP